MDITLSLVGLRDEQVGHVASNVVLIAHCITSKHFLQAVVRQSQHCHVV